VTVFFLVRHAAHDKMSSFLAGRACGIHLGETGRQQATRLAQRLKRERLDVIHTSPRERTLETACLIASASGLPVPEVAEGLDEIDFGTWSGRTFDDLSHDLAFQRWNEIRSLARTPAGESMLDVQVRILRHMEGIMATMNARMVVLVSHAEVIKAAVLYYLGLPLDAWSRFDIEPASITTLVLSERGAKLTGMNEIA
jgi:broad specificity phosphatase PhoE